MALLALKRLSASDLGIFQAHHGTTTQSNQKSINLNGNILVGRFYPALVGMRGQRFDVDLKVSGPGGRTMPPARHHVGFYEKNWRLNGAFIQPPAVDPHAFDGLAPGDIAVLRLHGTGTPAGDLEALLVQASDPRDAVLHARLVAAMRNSSMIAFSEQALAEAILLSTQSARSSVQAFSTAALAEIEEAAEGGSGAIGRLIRARPGQAMSPEALARAKAAAEQIGQEGELLVDAYLSDWGARNPGGWFRHRWISRHNAIAPLDFATEAKSGVLGARKERIDVKTTRLDFARPFHLSTGELRHAQFGSDPYVIFRVHRLGPDGALLRRSHPINQFAQNLLAAQRAALPAGISVDSFTVDPAVLTWEPEEVLSWP